MTSYADNTTKSKYSIYKLFAMSLISWTLSSVLMVKAQSGKKKPKHKKIIFVDDFLRGKDNQVFDFEFGRIVYMLAISSALSKFLI